MLDQKSMVIIEYDTMPNNKAYQFMQVFEYTIKESIFFISNITFS